MKKVRATNAYRVNKADNGEPLIIEDSELGRVPVEGEIFEVTEERFNKLIGNNIYGLVFVEEVVEEKKVEKPKRKTTKNVKKK